MDGRGMVRSGQARQAGHVVVGPGMFWRGSLGEDWLVGAAQCWVRQARQCWSRLGLVVCVMVRQSRRVIAGRGDVTLGEAGEVVQVWDGLVLARSGRQG